MEDPAKARAELQARKAALLKSHWVAADPKAKQEFVPVSSTPLDLSYQRSRSMTRDMLYERNMMMSKHVVDGRLAVSPASVFIAKMYQAGLPNTAPDAGMSRATMNIVLGSDLPYEPEPNTTMTTNSAYGSTTGHRHPPGINLLEMVEPRRDTTTDGAHRSSLTEQHLANIHNPWKSDYPERARSSTSGVLLRDLMHRHTRSGYNPDERCLALSMLHPCCALHPLYHTACFTSNRASLAADGAAPYTPHIARHLVHSRYNAPYHPSYDPPL